ncbi:hypothetical protein Tco_0542045 [Tanacetum coccineum]
MFPFLKLADIAISKAGRYCHYLRLADIATVLELALAVLLNVLADFIPLYTHFDASLYLILDCLIINTLIVQQRALDDALVAPDNRVIIGKCNMRIEPTKSQKEITYQVVLDALKLTAC